VDWQTARARSAVAALTNARRGLIALAIATPLFFWAVGRPEFWSLQIWAYQQADQAHFPNPGAIVFTGSSRFDSGRRCATI